ncbi:MAG: peptide/nickel transport system substrate-binding protein [Gaiellales bacterium]|jgi:ABC-type transport system substrate-binding protein|nr:peptide/nickel transport system substrate-binding protein [Gaiellales bacterium]
MAVPRRRRALLALFATLGLSLAISACGGGGSHVARPSAPLAPNLPAKHGGTLRLVAAAPRIALDPAFASDPASQRIAFVTCETLLTYADSPGEAGRTLIPGLARELPSVGKDGRSFTFALKAHVRFANGQVVTPADLKATFERLMDPKLHSPGARLFGDLKGLAAYRDGRADTITGITISAGGITFHLNTSGRSMLARVASAYTCPLPAGTPHRPIGADAWRGDATGPYRLAAPRAGRLTLVRNTRFTAPVLGPRGIADRIDVRLGLGAHAAVAAVAAGTADAVLDGPPGASRPLPAGALFLAAPSGDVSYLRIDAGWPPFDLQGVRTAISIALDRTAIAAAVGKGAAVGTDALLPATMPSARAPSVGALTPDPLLARRMYLRAIAEGGEKGPFDITLRACRRPVCAAQAVAVKDALDFVLGMDVRIVRSGERPLELGWLHPGYADPAAVVEAVVAPAGLRGPAAPPPVPGDSALVRLTRHADVLLGDARTQAFDRVARRIAQRADPVTVLAHANFPLVVSSLMTEAFVQPIVGIDLAALTPNP